MPRGLPNRTEDNKKTRKRSEKLREKDNSWLQKSTAITANAVYWSTSLAIPFHPLLILGLILAYLRQSPRQHPRPCKYHPPIAISQKPVLYSNSLLLPLADLVSFHKSTPKSTTPIHTLSYTALPFSCLLLSPFFLLLSPQVFHFWIAAPNSAVSPFMLGILISSFLAGLVASLPQK